MVAENVAENVVENGCLVICTDRELLFHAIERMVQGVYRCELVSAELLTTLFDVFDAVVPDCIVLDSEAHLPELIRLVQKGLPGLPLVVWQRANAAEASLHALEMGAVGVLHDSSTAVDVNACLRTVQAGHVWVPPSVAQASLDFRRYHLSPREWQVMDLVSQGLCNKEIAYSMGITEGTTKVYLSRMFDKLEVSDRYELALLGLKHFAQSHSHVARAETRSAYRTPAGGGAHPESVFVYRPPVRLASCTGRSAVALPS